MGGQVTEFHSRFTDVAVIWELRGNYPTDIPFFTDVDIAELTKGDDDPMFLTIPIGKANVVSGNKRFYDEAWLQELERQVVANRPIGIMGHLADDELATKFPQEAVHWVGVRRVNEMLWAKGYIPPGAARDRVRRYKATNKTLATSIFAKAEGIWNKARGALDMLAETLNLFQIDIGPADRVGISGLAMVPLLTSEMATLPDELEQQEIHMPDKLEIIQELKREDARLLPDEVRAAILETVATPPEVAQVQELREALGVDDKADLKAVVTEMRQTQETQRKDAIKSKITELVTDKDKGIKVEAVRGIVTELVTARNPQTVLEAETAYNDVAASAHVTELLKTQVVNTMGPALRTRVAGQQGAAKYFVIPTEKQEA